MDPDLNKYDVEHVCTSHSRMSNKEWQEIYHEAWLLYYTPEHMKTLLRRAMATGLVASPVDTVSLSGDSISAASIDIVTRMISSGQPHKATPLTGAMCLAVAARCC